MDWNENEHPRDKIGQFTDKENGNRVKTQLPINVCAAAGITLPSDVTAERAWEILKEKTGLTPDKVKEELNKKEESPQEKINSIKIRFDQDNILPELNKKELVKIGLNENKKILLKKNIIDRNFVEHSDLSKEDFQNIITKALYIPSEVFPANKNKPYYHFAKVIEINSKGKPEIGLALLDVDNKKEYFEIVHAHFVSSAGLKRYQNKNKD